MQKTSRIAEIQSRDWSFAHLKRSETLWGPHGYHRYPAKFIPQLVHDLIGYYSKPKDLVADLFTGSGTTGIETLRLGRRFYGTDINPVAVLISRAKCTPLNPSRLIPIWQDLQAELTRVPNIGRKVLTEQQKERIAGFHRLDATIDERLGYWFPIEQRQALECLSGLILQVESAPVRRFLLCGFSNILRNCSIWLSGSTKPQKDLDKVLGDPKEVFLRQIRKMIRGNQVYWSELKQSNFDFRRLGNQLMVLQKDVRQLRVADGTFDLIVTSPPYATCYQYHEIHQLTQLWLEQYGIFKTANWIQDSIGTRLARKVKPSIHTHYTGSEAADMAIAQLETIGREAHPEASHEARLLQRYFHDMDSAMKEFSRTLARDKYLILIIGDSYKHGIQIPTADALVEMAANVGFQLEQRMRRRVPARVLVSKRDRETGRFSSTIDSDIEAYPEESILVLRKSRKTTE